MLWVPGNATRTTACSDATCGASSRGDLVAGGDELSGSAEPVVRGKNRHQGEGGFGAGAHSDGDGMLGEVGDGPEPTNSSTATGGSEEGKNGGAAPRGFSGRVRWRGG